MADLTELQIKVTTDADRAASSLDKLSNSGNALTGIAGKLIGAFAAWKMGEQIASAVLLAARYDTLGVSLSQVGKNINYTKTEMDTFAKGVASMGISAIESRQSLLSMAQANLDLSKSTDLARVAQDAAVIANENSSETFKRLIYAITSGQPEMLRTIGILVSFETAYNKWATANNKTVIAMTETEKVQARMNAVLAKGATIAGTYEAAMSTAGKQIKSFERYLQDFEVAFGAAFQPALTALVFAAAESIKGLTAAVKSDEFVAAIHAMGDALVWVVTHVDTLAVSAAAFGAAWVAMNWAAITAGVATVTAALSALWAVILANPMVAAAAAAGVLATSLYNWAASGKTVQQELSALNKETSVSVLKFNESGRELQKATRLFIDYQTAISNAEGDTGKMNEASDKLSGIFPELTQKVKTGQLTQEDFSIAVGAAVNKLNEQYEAAQKVANMNFSKEVDAWTRSLDNGVTSFGTLINRALDWSDSGVSAFTNWISGALGLSTDLERIGDKIISAATNTKQWTDQADRVSKMAEGFRQTGNFTGYQIGVSALESMAASYARMLAMAQTMSIINPNGPITGKHVDNIKQAGLYIQYLITGLTTAIGQAQAVGTAIAAFTKSLAEIKWDTATGNATTDAIHKNWSAAGQTVSAAMATISKSFTAMGADAEKTASSTAQIMSGYYDPQSPLYHNITALGTAMATSLKNGSGITEAAANQAAGLITAAAEKGAKDQEIIYRDAGVTQAGIVQATNSTILGLQSTYYASIGALTASQEASVNSLVAEYAQKQAEDVKTGHANRVAIDTEFQAKLTALVRSGAEASVAAELTANETRYANGQISSTAMIALYEQEGLRKLTRLQASFDEGIVKESEYNNQREAINKSTTDNIISTLGTELSIIKSKAATYNATSAAVLAAYDAEIAKMETAGTLNSAYWSLKGERAQYAYSQMKEYSEEWWAYNKTALANGTKSATAQNTEILAKYASMLNEKKSDTEAHITAVKAMVDNDLVGAFEGAFDTIVKEAKSANTLMYDAWKSSFDAMTSYFNSGFYDIIKGNYDDLNDAFDDFCDALLKAWINVIAQMVAAWTASSIYSLFSSGGTTITSLFSSGTGGGTSGALSTASTGVTAASLGTKLYGWITGTSATTTAATMSMQGAAETGMLGADFAAINQGIGMTTAEVTSLTTATEALNAGLDTVGTSTLAATEGTTTLSSALTTAAPYLGAAALVVAGISAYTTQAEENEMKSTAAYAQYETGLITDYFGNQQGSEAYTDVQSGGKGSFSSSGSTRKDLESEINYLQDIAERAGLSETAIEGLIVGVDTLTASMNAAADAGDTELAASLQAQIDAVNTAATTYGFATTGLGEYGYTLIDVANAMEATDDAIGVFSNGSLPTMITTVQSGDKNLSDLTDTIMELGEDFSITEEEAANFASQLVDGTITVDTFRSSMDDLATAFYESTDANEGLVLATSSTVDEISGLTSVVVDATSALNEMNDAMSGGSTSSDASMMHTGGWITAHSGRWLGANAPGGEIPLIGLDGERVLSVSEIATMGGRQAVDSLAGGGGGGRGGDIHFSVNLSGSGKGSKALAQEILYEFKTNLRSELKRTVDGISSQGYR